MAEPLSPDALTYDLRLAGDAQASPDGARILYTVGLADRAAGTVSSDLWVCTMGGDEPDPRQVTGGGARNSGGRWSPDGRRIAFVSDRTPVSGVFVLPADGPGEAREVARHGQPITDLAWSPDGAYLAYSALYDPDDPDDMAPAPGVPPRVRVTRRLDYKQDNRGYLGDARLHVWVVDVETGARRRVSTAARDHTTPRWSPDGRRLATRLANHNGLCAQVAVIDVASGAMRTIGPEEGVADLWAWSPSGDRIIFAGDTRQTFQLDFFVCDLTQDAWPVRRLTHDLLALPDAGFPTIQPPAQPVPLDDRRVLFHALRAGASMLATLDCETGEVEDVSSWQAMHAGLSTDGDRRFIAQTRASFAEVGEVAVYDRETGETRVVTKLNDKLLRAHPPARWERLTVRRDPFDIEAWLLMPPDFDPARRYPVVLDVHGGPHGHYGYGFNAIQQCLATNGFLVVCANPRGSSSYGRTFAQQVVHDWGGEDYLDLMAIVDTVVERPYTDHARVGIFGYSYGGYMTAWTIGHTDRFKAAVCGAPCFDLESFYGSSDIGHIFGDLEFGGAPPTRREWYAAHSPSSFAHLATTPTLIIQGEADERCPIGQGEQMFVALHKAGCPVEFARYPGGSHLFLRVAPPAHRADALSRILAWFKEYLGEPT